MSLKPALERRKKLSAQCRFFVAAVVDGAAAFAADAAIAAAGVFAATAARHRLEWLYLLTGQPLWFRNKG